MRVPGKYSTMAVGIEVSNVSILAVGHTTHKPEHSSVKPLTEQVGVGLPFHRFFTRKGVTLEILWHRNTGEAKDSGREVDERDNTIADTPGTLRSQMLPLLWETDDQGHVITGVIDVPFCARQNPAVVGIIKNDRVVTDARFIEFLNPSANLLIHRRNDVHVGHPVLTKLWRIRVVGGQLDR